MRLLISADAPWFPTSFGWPIAQIARQLTGHGLEVFIAAQRAMTVPDVAWEGIPVLSSELSAGEHAQRVLRANTDDTVVVVGQPEHIDPAHPSWDRLALWFPVDVAHPAYGETAGRWSARSWAMSGFGRDTMAALGGSADYVPLGVDTTTLVDDPAARAEMRLSHDIGADAPVVTMVASNYGQFDDKGFAYAFAAFAGVLETRPDTILYLHTDIGGNEFGGFDLRLWWDALGLPPHALRWRRTSRPKPAGGADMRPIYSMSDVLLVASRKEGFCLPVIEAQSCGLTVVCSDTGPLRELNPHGRLVSGRLAPTSPSANPLFEPTVSSLTHELLAALEAPADPGLLRAHAVGYDISSITANHVLPALEAIS